MKRSYLFDPANYLKSNPDVAASGMDPILHYLKKGYKDGRTGNVLFDHRYYVEQLQNEVTQDVNPLAHYLSGGWKEGIKPNRFFDPCLYAAENPKIDFSSIDPLTYYIQKKENGSLPPYFDAFFYTNTYDDVSSSGLQPLDHYLKIGLEEKRQPSIYFDVNWYLDNNPVLQEKNIDPLMHYLGFGIAEGKSPTPLFDPAYYKQTYGIADNEDMFADYIQYGVHADHNPCRWFDAKFYREKYLSEDSGDSPLAHYIRSGVQAGCYPNRDVSELADKPLISILVPVYNVSHSFLQNCIRSVLYQSYPHWELCLVDDCSSDEQIRQILRKWAKSDKRIKVHFLKMNEGISGATNAAASLASGDYLGFLDNDDELTAECLFRVVSKINSEKGDLYYSDEVLIGDDGTQFSEFRKPDFNENLLLSHNYVTHFVVADAELFRATGGLDPVMSGAQDFDLFLKMSENAEKIIHIPEILYRWRAHESSTSVNHDQKSYANEAGRRALEAAMARRKIAAVVEDTEWKFFYHVNRELLAYPKVTVIIRFNDNAGFNEWLQKLSEKTTYSNVEYLVLIQEGEGEPKKTSEEGFPKHVTFLWMSPENSLVSMYNQGSKEAKGEYVVFLNSNVEVLSQSWIEEMLKQSMLPHTAFVAGRILPCGENEFISREPDFTNNSSLYYSRFLQECSRHLNGLECEQNVFTLSCDFSMVNRVQFLECGGFDNKVFPLLFADNDLCLRMRQKGYENIFTPFAKAKWLEAEDGKDQEAQSLDQEKCLFQKRWVKELCEGDPYYNLAVIGNKLESYDSFHKWYAGTNAN